MAEAERINIPEPVSVNPAQERRSRILGQFLPAYLDGIKGMECYISNLTADPGGLTVGTYTGRVGHKVNAAGETIARSKQCDFAPTQATVSGNAIVQVGLSYCQTPMDAAPAAVLGAARHLASVHSSGVKGGVQDFMRLLRIQESAGSKNLTHVAFTDQGADLARDTLERVLSDLAVDWPVEDLPTVRKGSGTPKTGYQCKCLDRTGKLVGIKINVDAGSHPPASLETKQGTKFPDCPDCRAPFARTFKSKDALIAALQEENTVLRLKKAS